MPNFVKFCFTTRCLHDIADFIIPIDYHVIRQKIKQEESKISNFTFLLRTFDETIPRSVDANMNFGSKSGVYVQKISGLKRLLPSDALVTKTQKKKKNGKNPKLKFHNSLNNFGIDSPPPNNNIP